MLAATRIARTRTSRSSWVIAARTGAGTRPARATPRSASRTAANDKAHALPRQYQREGRDGERGDEERGLRQDPLLGRGLGEEGAPQEEIRDRQAPERPEKAQGCLGPAAVPGEPEAELVEHLEPDEDHRRHVEGRGPEEHRPRH